jgi:hypothetical protein
MDSLDFLDSLSAGQDADESPSGFVQHPCGSFNGTIEKVTQKTVNDRPVWEIFVRTQHGLANHNRWGFSPQDMSNAKTRQDDRERMIGTIKRHKRLFVDCKVWNVGDAKSMKWNDILGAWVQLQGKACEVVVKPNHKKPGTTITFVNAPREGHVDQIDQIQPQPVPSAPASSSAAPTDTSRKLPGEDSSVNDIPF